MKKLMIAAAAAAMVGGVYATDCIGCGAGKVVVVPAQSPTYIVPTTVSCVAGHVWDITVKAKTIGNKCVSCKKYCEECDSADKANYYDNTSRTFTGVAWTCYCPCVDDNDFAGDDVQEKENMLFWDAKNKVGYGYIVFSYTEVPAPAGSTCTDCTYYQADWALDGVDVTGLDFVAGGEAFRYGKKAEKAAWGFQYMGAWQKLDKNGDPANMREQRLSIAALGLGTIKNYKATKTDEAYIVINKISGSCIGSVTACACPEDDEYTAQIIPVCYDFDNWCDDGELLEDVPFYGTFTAKYNEKKSKKLRTTLAYLQELFPAYCVQVLEPAK